MLANIIRKGYQEHIEEEKTKPGEYKPDLESFEAYIEYTFANTGETMTYKGFKEFKKGGRRNNAGIQII